MTLTGYIVLLSVVSSEKHEHPEVCDDASWNVSLIYEIHFTFSSGKEYEEEYSFNEENVFQF